jgi:hypothetical protein
MKSAAHFITKVAPVRPDPEIFNLSFHFFALDFSFFLAPKLSGSAF